jgi:endonuclease YncB( thermonuclease family)
MHYWNAPGRLLFAVVICFFALPCFGQDVTAFAGRVSAVTGGDVLTVVDSKNQIRKIRLAGIDAPESGQEFSAAAKDFLSGLVLDQPVTVVGSRSDTDGLLIAQVFLLGRDVSYSMLWAGLAWHDKEFQEEQTKEDRKRYADGEKFARGTKENIWSRSKPLPPWEYRKDHPEAPKESERTLALTQLNQSTQPAKPAATITVTPGLEFVGNKNSKIFHWNPGCPGFSKVSEKNRVPFASKAEAEAAGYRPAKNCRDAAPDPARSDQPSEP